ncbi:MAG: adenosylmethionine decarboxylase [Gammaproteobacteria bacterium]|nr:adenosylmethionine decarboxylase [Gammaproteobacteria bacterium]MDE0177719.1 adenosylmethionine decarboxylase [Gammaproteobacteria bacterium]MDE0441337.1 adenosylmethionine decarboxylase [Gammaproteobacteria bacterium]
MSTATPIRSAVPFAGRHLLIECFGAHANLDAHELETLLKDSAMAGGATVLSCHLHGFGKGGGVTGVALLAESHITVHTWPERGYAAFDVFMCGNCEATRAAKVIEDAVPGATVDIHTVDRPSAGAQS